jgi:hypothetical protein
LGRVTAGHLAAKRELVSPPQRRAWTVDIEVLVSAATALGHTQVLGVAVEVNWRGSGTADEPPVHTPTASCGSRTTRFLGSPSGPTHARPLPGPFLRELYAETRFGQPYRGDAIYLRDLSENEALAIRTRPRS